MVRVSALTVLLALAFGGRCGSSSVGRQAPVRLTGTVERVCSGPLRPGVVARCANSAVLQRAGARLTVHGRFSVLLSPGSYVVTIDGCRATQTLRVSEPMTVRLSPMCAYPT